MTKIQKGSLAAFALVFAGFAAKAQTTTSYGSGACDAGTDNSAFGYQALYSCTSSTSSDTAIGVAALYSNTTGMENTAVGLAPLYNDTTGSNNTAVGYAALHNVSSGSNNVAVGAAALAASSASGGVAVGQAALADNTTGGDNTALGDSALVQLTTGSGNIGVGYDAGVLLTGGASNNIEIGNNGTSSDSGTIRIGTSGTQTSFYAAGIYTSSVTSGVDVVVNSSGQLGIATSSIRFKEDVRDMDEASSGLFRLRPVTYRYKQAYSDGSKPIDYGLIAEEVAAVYPNLVARDANGQILTVQYQKLTPMLLNELQKQHRLLEQQASQLKRQSEQIDTLKRMQLTMERQAATVELLQKRLTALEAAQPAPTVVDAN